MAKAFALGLRTESCGSVKGGMVVEGLAGIKCGALWCADGWGPNIQP